MLSFFFDILSSLANAAWEVLSFLAHSALSILSGAATLISWPIRAMMNTLGNWWGVPTPWTPLFFIGGGILLLLLLALAGWAMASNRRRKYHR